MSEAKVYDDTRCTLGEGPLWHPLRAELFWFDILGRKLHRRGAEGRITLDLPELTSAAGWIDADRLLVASESALSILDIATGAREMLVPLEAENPVTRSNDGRADRQGGFWIGTMGKKAETGAGAIYRYYRGELRKLYSGLTIPNAICFAPDGTLAYWADTALRRIMSQRLDAEGWPAGAPEVFVDLGAEKLSPDGAVVDARGHLWNAQWGAARVAEYAADGRFLGSVSLPARHTSCPAFVGADLASLVCTSAAEGIAADDAAFDAQGKTYIVEGVAHGLPEPQVLL